VDKNLLRWLILIEPPFVGRRGKIPEASLFYLPVVENLEYTRKVK
jgi:hypothetical protein